jgi:hypothetical protein
VAADGAGGRSGLTIAVCPVPGAAAAQAVLVSDCMPTRGMTRFGDLAGLAERVGSLHICYIDDGQPVIEMHGSRKRLSLYEWWARRWADEPLDEVFESSAYRREMVRVYVRRALARALL